MPESVAPSTDIGRAPRVSTCFERQECGMKSEAQHGRYDRRMVQRRTTNCQRLHSLLVGCIEIQLASVDAGFRSMARMMFVDAWFGTSRCQMEEEARSLTTAAGSPSTSRDKGSNAVIKLQPLTSSCIGHVRRYNHTKESNGGRHP
jgi:hypothetical protein